MLRAQSSAVSRLFLDAGSEPPQIRWSPRRFALGHPMLERLMAVTADLSFGKGCLTRETVIAQVLSQPDLADWLMHVEAETPSGPFIYRHYGKGIAETRGLDMTGQATDAFAGHIGLFFTALYHACARRAEPVLSVHQPPQLVFVQQWRRLTLPICRMSRGTCGSGDVQGFLTMAIPENELRAGMEIIPDPVLILDRDQKVLFANRAAREAFDGGRTGPWNRDLFAYAGMTLSTEMSPEDLIGAAMVDERHDLRVARSVIKDLRTTISATMHRGRALYVLVVRID
jgi:hypothetical protein